MNSNILKLKLKRVDPVKYATVAAFLTALIMLILFVPFMLLFSLVGAGASSGFGEGIAIFGGGIFAIILVPIIYGVMVFIITLISTSLLNFILKKTGGIDIDFEKAGLDISQIGQDRRIEQ